MTRAILWKELREQLAILIALVVLGAAVVAGVVTMNPPSEVGSGTNDLNGVGCCTATKGFDEASGLGVPNFAEIAQHLPPPSP